MSNIAPPKQRVSRSRSRSPRRVVTRSRSRSHPRSISPSSHDILSLPNVATREVVTPPLSPTRITSERDSQALVTTSASSSPSFVSTSSITVNAVEDDEKLTDLFQAIREVYLNEDVHQLIARSIYEVNVTRDGSIGMYILTATPTNQVQCATNTRILAVVPTRLKVWLAEDAKRGTQEVEELLDHYTRPKDLSVSARLLIGASLKAIFSDLGPHASENGAQYFATLPTTEGAYMKILLRPMSFFIMQDRISNELHMAHGREDKLELIREMRDLITHADQFDRMWVQC